MKLPSSISEGRRLGTDTKFFLSLPFLLFRPWMEDEAHPASGDLSNLLNPLILILTWKQPHRHTQKP